MPPTPRSPTRAATAFGWRNWPSPPFASGCKRCGDPLSLDPARIIAKVTRQVAVELAALANSLEAAGHAPPVVGSFLTRCLFSMFAEDVGLLPPTSDGAGSFVQLLRQHREQPATLARMLQVFWAGMDTGGFNAAIAADVLRFNGELFKGAGVDGYVLLLNAAQIDGLLRAASADWREVEPAIFGTLLERTLHPTERHALGAHYTPRAYVERLVPPTLPEQVRAIAQLLTTSPTPLPLPAIEAAFKGKGPWKKSLPRLLDTLEALGRARQEGGGWRG